MNVATSSHRGGQASESETDFVQRLRAGDEQAYRMLVQQHGGRMLTVARRFLNCDADNADAVQEAFVSAFQALPSFEGSATLATWLHRILVNACLMRLRARSRRRSVSIDELLPSFDDTGHHTRPIVSWSEPACRQLEQAETRATIRAAIDQLPDDYRAIILLRDIEELDTETTADLLGISVAATKTRLHRARQALRTLLERVACGGRLDLND